MRLQIATYWYCWAKASYDLDIHYQPPLTLIDVLRLTLLHWYNSGNALLVQLNGKIYPSVRYV